MNDLDKKFIFQKANVVAGAKSIFSHRNVILTGGTDQRVRGEKTRCIRGILFPKRTGDNQGKGDNHVKGGLLIVRKRWSVHKKMPEERRKVPPNEVLLPGEARRKFLSFDGSKI